MTGIKILIDGRMLYYSGIGRYIRNLVVALLEYDSRIAISLAGSVKDIDRFRGENGHVSARIFAIPYDAGIYSRREALAFPFWRKASTDFDVVHFPHYNVPLLMPRNSVVTVHDVVQFTVLRAEYTRAKVYLAEQTLRRAIRARSILSVSETTKQQLVDNFGADEARITVAHPLLSSGYVSHPVDEVEQFRKQFGLNEDYLLYVGNPKKHKNTDILFKAFDMILKELPQMKLVVVGGPFDSAAVINRFASSTKFGRNIIFLPNVDDEDLPYIYSGAVALVMPSLEEGYGYPPLEALNCGTPTIVSDIPIFHETLGDGARFFDPVSADSLANTILNEVSRGTSRRGADATELRERSASFASTVLAAYSQTANILSL